MNLVYPLGAALNYAIDHEWWSKESPTVVFSSVFTPVSERIVRCDLSYGEMLQTIRFITTESCDVHWLFSNSADIQGVTLAACRSGALVAYITFLHPQTEIPQTKQLIYDLQRRCGTSDTPIKTDAIPMGSIGPDIQKRVDETLTLMTI